MMFKVLVQTIAYGLVTGLAETIVLGLLYGLTLK